MEIRPTSRPCQKEIHSPSAKPWPGREKEKSTSSAIRQDTYENSLQKGFHTDTLQRASADKLMFLGELPPAGELDIAEFETKDYVDWSWVEVRMSGSVSMDNGDSLIRQVDTMVSTYVGTKNHLEQTYAEDEEKLTEHMAKLNSMFTQAKDRITSSYGSTVGNFYEELGNPKFRQDAKKSLSSAIDRRVDEMDKSVKESGILEWAKGSSYRLIEFSLDVKSLNDHEAGRVTDSALEKGDEKYSLSDLETAGFAAKATSETGSKNHRFISDDEIRQMELRLASQYQIAIEHLKHLGLHIPESLVENTVSKMFSMSAYA